MGMASGGVGEDVVEDEAARNEYIRTGVPIASQLLAPAANDISGPRGRPVLIGLAALSWSRATTAPVAP